MRKLKRKIDIYFEIEGDTTRQIMYYGLIAFMLSIMFFGELAKPN